MPRHLLTILDVPGGEAGQLVLRAKRIKEQKLRSSTLAEKTVILIFEKASTRTRISFEVAVGHLGGESVFMTPAESQLGRNEPLSDTARVLSRYADCLVVRTFAQEKLETLARYASIPVINGLSDEYHPCQVLSDLLTMYERTPDFSSLKVAWIGDGNNMAHSWINAAVYFPFSLHLACPAGFAPRADILDAALARGAKVAVHDDPRAAAEGADYLNTDVWASMGREAEHKRRKAAFMEYQVDTALLGLAKPECKVMHCLPAHRGEEITEEVIESEASIVFDQAENRLHMQKAVLEWAFGSLAVDPKAVAALNLNPAAG